MYWADKVATQLKDKGPQLVDDMKTPSGLIHVGALRGVVIHDLIYKTLKEVGVKTRFTYIFDSMDPFDGLPVYLDEKTYLPYMGQPLFTIPSPDGEDASFAHYYAHNFQEVFARLGANPEILWSHEIYLSGKLNNQIKQALDNAEKIQDIYQEVSGSKKRALGWLPFQPICEKCGKVGTTISKSWDGKEVKYICSPDLVTWAKGCGHTGKISPLNGTGKLPWKVEWPAKWASLGVSVEGEGKDHSSAGGSRDIADRISSEVFGYNPPYDIPYEFFLFGGKKMSTSKGLGATAEEVSKIVPPYILRFLMARVRPNQAFDFDPEGNTIPLLFDDYDRAASAFYDQTDSDLGRVFGLSQIGDFPRDSKPFVVRFSLLAQWVQMPNINEEKESQKLKSGKLTEYELDVLRERIKYVNIWLSKYASKSEKFSVSQTNPDGAKNLTKSQKQLLATIAENIDKKWEPEDFQNQIYNWGKELDLDSKQAFESIYLSLINKTHGPKAGWLILSLEKGFVKKRFLEVSSD